MTSVSRYIHSIVESGWFQSVILGVIVLASIVVGLETNFTLVERHATLFDSVNHLILTIFVIEILLRVAAHGKRPWEFFFDAWNVFDFFIVLVTALPMHAEFFAVFRLVRLVRIFRIMRVVRVFKAVRILRLVPHLRELQFVVNSLVRSIPPITSVALLLGLHFYIYAVIGTFLFHAHDPLHFGSLGSSLLSLFETLTLEGWVDLMRVQMEADGIHSVVTIMYFVSFIVLGTMIIMNLVIGAVVSTMSEEKEEEEEVEHLKKKGVKKLTVRQELRVLEDQLKEATVCLRLLQKTIKSQENGQK